MKTGIWLPIEEIKNIKDTSKVLVLFDTHEWCEYNEDHWPRSIATHFLVIPNFPLI